MRYPLFFLLASGCVLSACGVLPQRTAPAPPPAPPPAPVVEAGVPVAPQAEMTPLPEPPRATLPKPAATVAPAQVTGAPASGSGAAAGSAAAEGSANPAVLALLGKAQTQTGSGALDEAAATLERAVNIEPRNGVLWHRLAVVRFRQGKLAEAAQLAAKSNALTADEDLTAANNTIIQSASP